MCLIRELHKISRWDSRAAQIRMFNATLDEMRCVAEHDTPVYKIVKRNPDGTYSSFFRTDPEESVTYRPGVQCPHIDVTPKFTFDETFGSGDAVYNDVREIPENVEIQGFHTVIDNGYFVTKSLNYWYLGIVDVLGKEIENNGENKVPAIMKMVIPKGTTYYSEIWCGQKKDDGQITAETVIPVSVLDISVKEL